MKIINQVLVKPFYLPQHFDIRLV